MAGRHSAIERLGDSKQIVIDAFVDMMDEIILKLKEKFVRSSMA